MKKLLCSTLLIAAAATSAHAAIIDIDIVGTAGPGLLPGNEPGSVVGGTGGEIGAGITFNDETLQLTINVGWGSSQGFTNLSSTATLSHIHGATASNNGNGFTQTAGVLFNLTRSSNEVTGGTIMQTITYTPAQAVDLFNGKHYINIHTSNNGGGELRGFLVPEPSTAVLGLVGVLGLLSRRRPGKV